MNYRLTNCIRTAFFLLPLAAPALCWAQPADKAHPGVIVLKATGLAAEDSPEALLPGGALIHVRLKSPQSLVDNISAMAAKFVPQDAVPGHLRQAFDQPNPLLALIGIQTMGGPLTVEGLSATSGIDLTRPVTLSMYLGPPDQSFILLVPAKDLTALSHMLGGMLRGAQVEEVNLNGGSALQLRTQGTEIFLVCSRTTVCACGSRQLAQRLLTAPREDRLDHSEFISKAIKQHQKDKLLLIVDAKPIKPLLPLLEQFSRIPDGTIQGLRQQLLAGGRKKDLENFNMQLRKRWGIRDVDQLLDYVECLATGSYEVLAENLQAQAADFEGLTLALDLSADFQRLHFSVHSKAITAAAARRPLPLAEIGKVISKLPGSHNSLSISGQSPPAAKPQIVADILARIGEKMKRKGLPPEFHKILHDAYAGYQPAQELDSKVPWMITLQTVAPGYKGPGKHASLKAYLEHLNQDWTLAAGVVELTAIPRQKKGFLEAHIRQETETSNANDRVYRRLLEQTGQDQPFYLRESRSSAGGLPGGVTKLVEEDSYTTRWGLFGYNEHELINRRFTLARDVGDITLMYPGGRDPSVLGDFESRPIPVAVERLLAETHVPPDANHVEILRVLQTINDVTDTLAELESLMHKDLAGYLSEVEAVRKKAGSQAELLSSLAKLDMPPEVYQLKRAENGDFYVTTPVQLTYPRPKVMTEALALLADYRKVADSVGGAAAYQRTQDGRFEVVFVQSTEALATLTRTVGNQIAQRYLQDPHGMKKLQALLQTPRDDAAREDEAILTNPTWEFLSTLQPERPRRELR